MFTKSYITGVRKRATAALIAVSGLVLAGMAAAAPAEAAGPWFVGGSGAVDTNACTSAAAPCATVAGVLAKSGFASGDTIDIAQGTYAQRPVFSTKGANLVGLGTGAAFDGGSLGNTSTMAVTGAVTLSLTNITLQNGSNTASPYGGNLRIQAGTVNATNVTITGGSSQAGGGVVQYPGTTFTMTGGSIKNNSASIEGGAIYSNGATTTLTDVAVTGNTAVTAGGAIMTLTTTTAVTMNGGSLSGNSSLLGGALYNVGTATFGQSANGGTTVSNNTANGGSTANGGNGGAIFNTGILALTGATMNGNRAVASTASSLATGWGGAIFSGPAAAGQAPKLTINSSTISGGSVSGGNAVIGGAIADAGNVFGVTGTVTPGALTATKLTLTQNVALAGGGIYAGGAVTLTGSSLQGNQATSTSVGYGGGIYAVASPSTGPQPNVIIDSTAVNSNSAGVVGGGIATLTGATTTIRNSSSVDGNTSSVDAGGVYNTGTLTATGSDISNNTAAYQGGGIYNGAGSAALANTKVDGNSAANLGGGIETLSGATLTTSGGEMNNNSAIGGGAVMVTDNGSAAFDGTSFVGNTASSVGGGAILNSGATTITHASITGNHAVHTTGSTGVGGAIYSGSVDNNVTMTLRVSDSTIANNDAYAGAALTTYATGTGSTDNSTIDNSTITGNTNSSDVGAIEAFNPVTVTSSTVTANTAVGGAGAVYAYGSVGFTGSILASNSGTECAAVTASSLIDGGYNLADSAARCGFGGTDFVGAPQLGALADNGGQTQTQLPGPASPALDRIAAGTSTSLKDAISGNTIILCGSSATDQRGTARPQGAKCDIGAVEVVQVAPTVSGPSAATYSLGAAGAPVTFTTTGTPQATLSESGTLPAGVTFKDNGDGTATLSGTPTAGPGGQYPITVTATNEAGPGTAAFTLTLNQAPALSGPSAATYTVGTAGTPQVFSQSGGYPVAVLSTTSTLPAGVSFTPASDGTGTIAGTPAAGSGGVYPVTITGDNGTPPAATLPFSLTVDEAAAVSGPSSATFQVGSSGTSDIFTATGYPTPALTADGLPSGLHLTSAGSGQAQISGTPTVGTGGTYAVTVTASNGIGDDATTTVQVTVNEAPSIVGADDVRFVAGVAGTTVYTTGGYPAPSLSESGTLPAGITFVDNGNGTATLAGTAATSAVGAYSLTITAHNGIGTDSTTKVTLEIVPALAFTTASLGNGNFGTEYGATIEATGGIPPYTVTLASGSLPGGLSLASDGTVSGMPTGVGTFNFSVAVADSNSPADTVTKSYSITIAKGATTLAVNPVALNVTTTLGVSVSVGTVSAQLVGGNPANGLAGQTVTFKVGSTVVCTGTTAASGSVSCVMSVVNTLLATLNLGVSASYAGDSTWQASSGSSGLISALGVSVGPGLP